jgi:hypothetical protein
MSLTLQECTDLVVARMERKAVRPIVKNNKKLMAKIHHYKIV